MLALLLLLVPVLFTRKNYMRFEVMKQFEKITLPKFETKRRINIPPFSPWRIRLTRVNAVDNHRGFFSVETLLQLFGKHEQREFAVSICLEQSVVVLEHGIFKPESLGLFCRTTTVIEHRARSRGDIVYRSVHNA